MCVCVLHTSYRRNWTVVCWFGASCLLWSGQTRRKIAYMDSDKFVVYMVFERDQINRCASASDTRSILKQWFDILATSSFICAPFTCNIHMNICIAYRFYRFFFILGRAPPPSLAHSHSVSVCPLDCAGTAMMPS